MNHYNKRNILFPIETTARELDSRIILGVKVVRPGDLVVIADQQLVRFLSYFLKGGLFFGKHLFGKPSFSDDKYYRRLKGREIDVIYLSEEGGVWPGNEEFWAQSMRRMERPSLFNKDDTYCAWGQWQLDYTRKSYKLNCESLVTGTPRFSILGKKYRRYYDYEKGRIQKKYGKFFLINTSFSAANGVRKELGWFGDSYGFNIGDPDSRIRLFGKYSQQMIAIARVIELVNALSLEFPDYGIVIRPHPSEDMEYYSNIFKLLPNVHVVYKGAAVDWVNASEILIQSGCTTALEAVLLGKKVINFAVTNDPETKVKIPEQCGLKISGIDEIINTIKTDFDNPLLTSIPSDDESLSLIHNLADDNCLELLDQVVNDQATSERGRQISIPPGYVICLFHRLYLKMKNIYFIVTKQTHRYRDYINRFKRFSRRDVERKIFMAAEIEGKKIHIVSATPFSVTFRISCRD